MFKSPDTLPWIVLNFLKDITNLNHCILLMFSLQKQSDSLSLSIMARKDQITQKKKRVANNVSHSNRKTKRTQEINLQTKRFFIEEQNRWVKLRVTTRSIRTISKISVLAFAKTRLFFIIYFGIETVNWVPDPTLLVALA